MKRRFVMIMLSMCLSFSVMSGQINSQWRGPEWDGSRPGARTTPTVVSDRIKKGSGEHWAHPVIKNGRLYIRHGDALMVYHIAR